MKNPLIFLRISIGIVYVWFGMLKFWPDLSPAEELAQATLETLSFGILPSQALIICLAVWEVLIGLFLLSKLFEKVTLYLAMLHLLGTFTPLFIFPELSFNAFPASLTLIGQYILKNLVLASGLLVLNQQQNHLPAQ